MPKWNDWAYHVQRNVEKEKFLDKIVEKIPVSIRRNHLWSIVILCCVITLLSCMLFCLELMTKVGKMSLREICFFVRRIKEQLKIITNLVCRIKDNELLNT